MARYKYISGGVLDTLTNKSIPNCDQNPDWVVYKQWVVQGGTTSPMYTQEQIQQNLSQRIHTLYDGKVASIIPASMQSRAIARMVELVDLKIEGGLSVSEQIEYDTLKSKWEAMKTIRQQEKAELEA